MNYSVYRWLQNEIKMHDLIYYASGEIYNPQRLMRALEIKLVTGVSIKELQKSSRITRGFNIIKYGIDIPKKNFIIISIPV